MDIKDPLTRELYDILFELPANVKEGDELEFKLRDAIKDLNTVEKAQLKAQIDGIDAFCMQVRATLNNCSYEI